MSDCMVGVGQAENMPHDHHMVTSADAIVSTGSAYTLQTSIH